MSYTTLSFSYAKLAFPLYVKTCNDALVAWISGAGTFSMHPDERYEIIVKEGIAALKSQDVWTEHLEDALTRVFKPVDGPA